MSPVSLDQLHDIVLPTEPGIWPLAIGWWLLIIIVAAGLFFTVKKLITHYQFWAIKRTALKLLSSCKDCNDLNQLLKQVVIHYCDDEKVSSLTGNDWVNFIALNLEPSSKNKLTEINNALYSPNHTQYFEQYSVITKQWLSNLNSRSLLTMNANINVDGNTEINNVNL